MCKEPGFLLQIDQKVDEEWPLTVIDHKKDRAKVFLKPGEMLLYESAKMPHGRQFPFNGDYFDNLFVHFRLKKWHLNNKHIFNAKGGTVLDVIV